MRFWRCWCFRCDDMRWEALFWYRYSHRGVQTRPCARAARSRWYGSNDCCRRCVLDLWGVCRVCLGDYCPRMCWTPLRCSVRGGTRVRRVLHRTDCRAEYCGMTSLRWSRFRRRSAETRCLRLWCVTPIVMTTSCLCVLFPLRFLRRADGSRIDCGRWDGCWRHRCRAATLGLPVHPHACWRSSSGPRGCFCHATLSSIRSRWSASRLSPPFRFWADGCNHPSRSWWFDNWSHIFPLHPVARLCTDSWRWLCWTAVRSARYSFRIFSARSRLILLPCRDVRLWF